MEGYQAKYLNFPSTQASVPELNFGQFEAGVLVLLDAADRIIYSYPSVSSYPYYLLPLLIGTVSSSPLLPAVHPLLDERARQVEVVWNWGKYT